MVISAHAMASSVGASREVNTEPVIFNRMSRHQRKSPPRNRGPRPRHLCLVFSSSCFVSPSVSSLCSPSISKTNIAFSIYTKNSPHQSAHSSLRMPSPTFAA
ncbi:unnamed protein product [Chondrus crispus]|uniref:Uncharacterized protein n=1 Tax=Chondrus crispus TaxID=2769 RepID=R7QJS1_CHOCR|nr:unnamed protein product [Chondrus crispus]CDF38772.1 unnamed protein product [Chondrus crispus]|eukprot:XP_005718677.1 unnamed protein product [Chondrus crispus]